MKKTHELKTWSEYFRAIWDGNKTFEVRENDRDFEEGDILLLREYEPSTREYSGRYITCLVGFMITGEWGIPSEISVMSLLSISRGNLKSE